ncbi:hypothetical protein B0J12DRAFT_772444 [Macrophomina phaseolina]|uniref:FAD-binding PCMH-type domain-containing protein n=1 Tax=Macrophomina phaseolina TaxID=35725 RepID=A0ABQ8GK45_9PEZI|nr:hypothetical protein B0J12DRAFT_772444 [Macrophomina phaseolina]
MDSSLSFKRVAKSLFFLAPALVAAQDSKAAELQSCLTAAGVESLIEGAATWANVTASCRLPQDRDQLAASLSCARNASVKVSQLGGSHSFAGYGFGNPGNLIVSLAAFNSVSYDEASQELTFGGGTRVGPVATYLWENYGRHFPHVRSGHVGLVGSSIGGGFGTTSRFLGLPMDNIVGVEYMLYNGTVVSGREGSDLLWAAKGAGSSYGVILSMTTKTWKPIHEKAVNFTLSLGNADLDTGVKATIAIQDYATTDAPDELALRWRLTSPPWDGTGYFYGDPAEFDTIIQPLLDRLPSNATLTKSEFDFWTMEQLVTGGIAAPNGGTLGGRAFYTQALTITADAPLTYDLAYTLFESTTYNFSRTDLRKSGFLDLMGGVSRDVSDADTSYAHGNDLWLIRWEANAADPTAWPEDGVEYLKNQMLPFEQQLTAADIPLRGFVNYRDTALTEAEWSARLYGEENYARLKEIKAAYDPEALFTSNEQSIPLP